MGCALDENWLLRVSAMFTPLNVQGAGVCSPKLSRLFYASFALGAFQPLWMKMLKDPLGAIFFFKKFCNWKFHAQSLTLPGTSFIHEPTSLAASLPPS